MIETAAPLNSDLLAPLDAGLDQLVAAVESGALRGLDNQRLLGFVAGFERVRNRLALVDHQVVVAWRGPRWAMSCSRDRPRRCW